MDKSDNNYKNGIIKVHDCKINALYLKFGIDIFAFFDRGT